MILSEASVKVLFLDIDGVVNNEHTRKKFGDFITLDPARVALVQRIVRNTGCEIVLSSLGGYSRMAGTRYKGRSASSPISPRSCTHHADMRSKYGLRGILKSNIMRFWTMPEASFPSNGRISSKLHGKVA